MTNAVVQVLTCADGKQRAAEITSSRHTPFMIGSMLFAFSAYNTQSGPVAVAGWMWLRVSNQSGHAEVDNPLKCEPHSPRTCNYLWGGEADD